MALSELSRPFAARSKDKAAPASAAEPLLAGGVAAAAVAYPQAARAASPPKQRFEDLTHVLTEEFPVFTFDPPTRETLVTIPSGGFYAQQWTIAEHTGTHMDAPGHFIVGGRLAPEITPRGTDRADHRGRYLCAGDARPGHGCNRRRPALRAAPRPDPRRRGRLHELGLGGQGRRPARCTRAGRRASTTTFPASTLRPLCGSPSGGTSPVSEWKASLDLGNSTTFPVHLDFLATDRYGLDNLNNLDKIPPRGALAYVGLIPWEEGWRSQPRDRELVAA